MSARTKTIWTFVITSIALFMVTLDNLVVTTAIPVIREDLNASLENLEWTVNAYTLTFAVLLLTGAALGDRFGRRRVFAIGIGVFTLGSIAAALAPNVEALVLARALQGVGGALVMPLTLTILSAAVPKEKRGLALGAWGGISGLAVAFGPVVGGAVVQGLSWQWIFWLNVPVGVILIPLALTRLQETYGPGGKLDLTGLALVSAGLFGIVWGLVRGNAQGWGSPEIVGSLARRRSCSWRRSSPGSCAPPRRCCRCASSASRAFALANLSSLFMFFGMFGSIFLLSQFFQTVQGYSPLGSGLRILPWTLAPMFISPIAGALSDRIPGKTLVGIGLTLQAGSLIWMGMISTPTVPYSQLIAPFVIAGIGMSLFFAPMAHIVLSSVRPVEEGQASGANNAIRELGGVFGVAVLAAVFASLGGYESAQAFSDGMNPALIIGGIVVGLGAVAAFAIPGRSSGSEAVTRERAFEAA